MQATLTERDSFIWNDNDVELFVAGDDCYYELEINAFGTVYEAFFVWQDALVRGSRFERAGLDPMSRKVDLLGGFQDASRYGKHPRGRRFAFLDFDLAGLETAVRVDGTINDPATTDRGWTRRDGAAVEEPGVPVRRPHAAARRKARRYAATSRASRRCACTASRCPQNPGWSLNPHGVYDSHIPESFSVVHFTEKRAPLADARSWRVRRARGTAAA